jgi:hypothetical protein
MAINQVVIREQSNYQKQSNQVVIREQSNYQEQSNKFIGRVRYCVRYNQGAEQSGCHQGVKQSD